VIINLTDDEGNGVIDESKVEEAIKSSSSEIDGYVQMRYPLPLSPIPPILTKLSADIAVYNLFSRRGFEESTADKVIVDRYKNAIRFLEKVAVGSIRLGAEAPKQDATVDIQSGDRRFSRNSMKGF
jgi:phage gp36-like protein